MKTVKTVLLATGLLMTSVLGAQAQTRAVAGHVYQVTSDGVTIQNTNGLTFVPANRAKFYLSRTKVNHRQLGVGQLVTAYADQVIQQGVMTPRNYQEYRGDAGRRWSQNWSDDDRRRPYRDRRR